MAHLAPYRLSREEPLVVIMVADPKPRHCVVLKYAQGSIAERYADGPDILRGIDALEPERRMERILSPQTKSLPRAGSCISIEGAISFPKRGDGLRVHSLAVFIGTA
jgi:hypothetical protein